MRFQSQYICLKPASKRAGAEPLASGSGGIQLLGAGIGLAAAAAVVGALLLAVRSFRRRRRANEEEESLSVEEV